MLKKLFNGEFSLRATFWKYGVLGLTILYYAYKMLKSLAGYYGIGTNWLNFFRNLNITKLANLNVAWFLGYLAISLFMIVYSYGIIKGTWRAAAAYEKSAWLAQLARLTIIGMVAAIWYIIIEG